MKSIVAIIGVIGAIVTILKFVPDVRFKFQPASRIVFSQLRGPTQYEFWGLGIYQGGYILRDGEIGAGNFFIVPFKLENKSNHAIAITKWYQETKISGSTNVVFNQAEILKEGGGFIYHSDYSPSLFLQPKSGYEIYGFFKAPDILFSEGMKRLFWKLTAEDDQGVKYRFSFRGAL